MRTLFALFLMATALNAGSNVRVITGAEWRLMVTGRTVEYSINGALFVREYYWPGADVVTMEVVGEECFEARWDYDPATSTFCFHNGPTACFRHLRDGNRLYVQDADPGANFGSTQEITAIKDMRLACTTAPVS